MTTLALLVRDLPDDWLSALDLARRRSAYPPRSDPAACCAGGAVGAGAAERGAPVPQLGGGEPLDAAAGGADEAPGRDA